MKNKIESRSEFKTNIKQNPFKLLKVIKEHSMNYHENKYNMLVIFNAQMNLFTTKQREGESLQDYTKRFQIAREVFEALNGGPIKLNKILQDNQGYTKSATTIVKHEKNILLEKKASEQYLAFIYINNAEIGRASCRERVLLMV